MEISAPLKNTYLKFLTCAYLSNVLFFAKSVNTGVAYYWEIMDYQYVPEQETLITKIVRKM